MRRRQPRQRAGAALGDITVGNDATTFKPIQLTAPNGLTQSGRPDGQPPSS